MPGSGNAFPSIRTVAVIGAGDRGRAFAFRCAESGFNTVLQDVLSSRLRRVEDLLTEAPATLRERLSLAGVVEDAVREADLAIDFVPDELESKLEIFSMLDRMAPPKTILCTPTQLDITDLASCTYRAEQCVGLHLFAETAGSEAQLIPGARTSQAVLSSVHEWLAALQLRVLATQAVPV